MTIVTIICALVAGGCLMAIQVRHMGKRTFIGSLFDKEVQQELRRSLDATDKQLAVVSLVAFIIMLVLVALGYMS
ncbi:hypothetical protein MYX04_13575 [Nitrospiraceae bacterium AH_259_D15_M11_P09]|nr:hypothetical protein [Nitrospiraceae bacterium AH_259_D15_M11_P09]